MRNNKTRQVALSGLLFALAIVLSFFENIFVAFLGFAPGIKIGLANIVVMYALFFMGFPQALTLTVLKAFFVGLRVPTAAPISLGGGLMAIFAMWLLYKLPRRPTVFIVSVCGAVSHNIGQIIVYSLMSGSALTLTYAPILIISGLGMGFITSSSLAALLPALGKMGFSTQPRDSHKNS